MNIQIPNNNTNMAGISEDDCLNYLVNFVRLAGHKDKFFAHSRRLTEIARSGPRRARNWVDFVQKTMLVTPGQAKDCFFDMLKLALYDIHFLIGECLLSRPLGFPRADGVHDSRRQWFVATGFG